MEKSFDARGYSKDDNRPLTIRKNEKVMGLMKDELEGKIEARNKSIWFYTKFERR